MTRNDRIQAFRLRLDGLSWRQVGEVLGYDGRSVQRDVEQVVRRGQRRPKTPYAGFSSYIIRFCGGSIQEFARQCCLPYSTVYAVLTGDRAAGEETLERLLTVTGLTVEEAFAPMGGEVRE